PRVVEPLPDVQPAVARVNFPVPAPEPAPVPPRVEPPRPPDAPLVQALRCVLEGRPGAATEALQRCDASTREVVLTVLQPAAPLGDGGLGKASPHPSAPL